MIAFEGWAYQLLIVLGGYISINVLAACTAMFNALIVLYKSCLGVAQAANTLIGNSIGKLKVKLAKFYL